MCFQTLCILGLGFSLNLFVLANWCSKLRIEVEVTPPPRKFDFRKNHIFNQRVIYHFVGGLMLKLSLGDNR